VTSSLRWVISTLAFASELALLVVLVIIGLSAGLGTAANVALAVLAPLAVAVIWGFALAPRARRRLAQPWRLGAKVALFVAAAAGLAAVVSLAWAIVFAAATIGITVAAWLTDADG
jgi:Protein of unknown function (DUF2568)